MNMVLTSVPNTFPKMENSPTTTTTSCRVAMMAATP